MFPRRKKLAEGLCKTLKPEEQLLLCSSAADLMNSSSNDIPPYLSPACVSRVLIFALLYPASDGRLDTLVMDPLGCGNEHNLSARLAHLYV